MCTEQSPRYATTRMSFPRALDHHDRCSVLSGEVVLLLRYDLNAVARRFDGGGQRLLGSPLYRLQGALLCSYFP